MAAGRKLWRFYGNTSRTFACAGIKAAEQGIALKSSRQQSPSSGIGLDIFLDVLYCLFRLK
jgi:hypothetical protein